MVNPSTHRHVPDQQPPREAYSVEEFAALYGLSRTSAYIAVRRGEVPAVRIGRRLLIPRRELERFLERASASPE